MGTKKRRCRECKRMPSKAPVVEGRHFCQECLEQRNSPEHWEAEAVKRSMHKILCSFLGLVRHHRGVNWEEAVREAEELPGPLGDYVKGQDKGYARMVAHQLGMCDRDCGLCFQLMSLAREFMKLAKTLGLHGCHHSHRLFSEARKAVECGEPLSLVRDRLMTSLKAFHEFGDPEDKNESYDGPLSDLQRYESLALNQEFHSAKR